MGISVLVVVKNENDKIMYNNGLNMTSQTVPSIRPILSVGEKVREERMCEGKVER